MDELAARRAKKQGFYQQRDAAVEALRNAAAEFKKLEEYKVKLTPNLGDYREHKEGQIYQANITAIEDREGDNGTYLLYTIKGPDIADDTKLVSSALVSNRSKLGKWIKALYPDYGFDIDFDTDMLIGMPVAVTFEHEQDDAGGWRERGNIVAKGNLDPSKGDDAPF